MTKSKYPLVKDHMTLPEITMKGLIISVLGAIILSGATAYLGLFAGSSISVSIPSSILSMSILKPFGSNILEINCVQTAISAGSTLTAGIIYTIPALALLPSSIWGGSIHYFETVCITLVGGLIGVLFAIPLRRAFIVNNQALSYPEGTAIAQVLEVVCGIPSDDLIQQKEQNSLKKQSRKKTHPSKLIPNALGNQSTSSSSSHNVENKKSDSLLSKPKQNKTEQTESDVVIDSTDEDKEGHLVLTDDGKLALETFSNDKKDEIAEKIKDKKRYVLVAVTVIGIVLGFLIKLSEGGFKLWQSHLSHAFFLFGKHGALFYFGLSLSPALFSVGYILKLKSAIVLVIGGIIGSWVSIPIFYHYFRNDYLLINDPMIIAKDVFINKVRFIGVGAMLTGGICTFLSLVPSITTSMSAILISGLDPIMHKLKNLSTRSKRNNVDSLESQDITSHSNQKRRSDQDFPVILSILTLVIVTILLFTLLLYFSNLNLLLSLFILMFTFTAGFMFTTVGSYIAGLVGSSNAPVSGVTIGTIITISVILLLWLGKGSALGASFSILAGAIICCAAAIGADTMQDLKSAFLVGATPKKVQFMQIIGVITGSFFIPLFVKLLISAYGIGSPTQSHPNPLPAPQALLMSTIASSMFYGQMPVELISIGAIVGFCVFIVNLFILDCLLSRYTTFRFPVLAMATGLYLPQDLTMSIMTGAIANSLCQIIMSVIYHQETKQKTCDMIYENEQKGTLICAGIITGESIAGIMLAVPFVILQNSNALALFGGMFANTAWPGVVVFATVIGLVVSLVLNHPISHVLSRTCTRSHTKLEENHRR